MSTATFGTANEDNAHLIRSESKAVRRRSLALLGSLIRPVRLRFWLTLATVVLSQAARVAGPALIGFGIDRALPALQAGDNLPLVLTGAAYLAAAVATAGLTALYVTSTAKLSQAMLLDLRVRVFRHTQRLSLEFHEKYTSGRIIARQTSDLEALRELLDSGVSSLASGILFMVFTAITVFALDWRSGLLVLAAGVPMYFLSRWYQKHSQIVFRESRVVSARLIVHFVETMTGIRAVKAFRKERENAERYGELSEDYRKVTVRSINLNGVFQPGLVLIGNVCVAVVLLVGGFRVLGGDLAVGVLLALMLSTKRFFQPVDQMAMFYNSFQSAQAALEKVSGLLEEVPTVRPPRNPVALTSARGAIDFSKVEFRYGDGPVVIPEMDLHIPAGQTVALVGQTGAGKSTLAKLIARFYDVSSGSLTLDGVDLRNLTTTDLRHNVVMVTQEAFLFSGSVADNIALGRPSASRGEIEEAARAVGAHEFITELPEGFDTDVNKRGGRVSAGQRQLISFARAFLARPAVLILDEATSSLDIPSERMVQSGLARLLRGTAGGGAPGDRGTAGGGAPGDDGADVGADAGADAGAGAGRTALIIAHRLSTVETADRVLVVHDGRVVEDGTPEQLIGGGGRFAQLHGAWKDSLV
jgi:ATP-binding cassette subfamily B protein